MATACYLRNLSTEHKATEITMDIFNFKRLLQAHDLPFRKVFQGRNSVQVAAFVSEFFNLLIIGFYL